jgi:hypothetical protein
MNNIGLGWVALGALGLMGVASNAHAFKTGTHSATATEVAHQLSTAVNQSGGTLHFEIDGRPLDIAITEAEAFAAVTAHVDFFRAGAVGPDAFPDPLTGQIMMHGDQSDLVKDVVEKISGSRPPLHDHADFFENRKGPAEFRSIDFATAMIEFLNTRYSPSATERGQILAFIMGYISHGVGDSFSHTWVNELAGGAWSLSKGSGLWGPFSEEIKHIAVETMVDKLVPPDLTSLPGDGGGQELIRLRAPIKFLDAFYSSLPVHSGLAAYDKNSGLKGFIDHFKNFNSYHGGFFYNYLNAQTQVAPSLKAWSGLGGLFDLAEDINDNQYVNFGLDIAELPEKILAELSLGNPLGWVDELTGGFIDCHADPKSGFPTPIKDLREALDYVGGISDRVDLHSNKSAIIRKNWVLLAQCTSENMARANAKNFDPQNPGFNRDSCADVVRAGWVDEGNPGGLDRGDVRPRDGVENIAYIDLNDDERFLLDLKAAFLGEDASDLFLLVDDPINNHAVWEFDEAMEGKNEHRSLGANLTRMLDYVTDFGFRVDELGEIIQPNDDSSIKDDYESFCSAARDPGFERCLDVAFGPLAAAGRGIACRAEHLLCTASNVKTCLQEACMDACPLSNAQCADACGTGEPSGCEKGCDKYLCFEACIPFTNECVDVCEPVTHTLCTKACDLFSSEEDTCLESALDEVRCGVEAIKCDVDNFAATITNDNYADKLLVPARQACDVVDEALRLFKCLKGDPNLPKEQQEANRRDCIVDLCAQNTDFPANECAQTYDDVKKGYDDAMRVKDAVSTVTDALRDRPAHEVVNLAFLLEDAKRSPEYLNALKNTIASTRANWTNNPPPATAPQADKDLHVRKGKLITRWEKLVTDVQNLGTSSDPLTDFEKASNEAADLIRQSTELGLIPTIIGPTAQQIYADIGPKFKETFLPFFNALQGMKLAPMTRADMDETFTVNASLEGSERLPWMHDKNSPVCSGAGANPYCDVFKSFDDPNCIDCGEASLKGDPNRFNWVPGRGMVAWNGYSSDTPIRHITTALPFANSDDAYDHLYTRIFQVPPGVPEFAGFDDPDAPWTSAEFPLSINDDNKTQGAGSLQVNACGQGKLESPIFNTADWGAVGDKLKLDVYVPSPQQEPYFVGGLQFFITVQPANLVYQPIGYKDLTPLPRGQWSTLEFTLPPEIKNALLGDFARARFHIQLDYRDCTRRLLLDNIRFAGDVVKRQNYHLRGSQKHSVTTNPLFSFDDVTNWGSSGSALVASTNKVQGTGSVGVNATWWTTVVSRPFNTNELVGVTRRMSLDVFVPEPSGNEYWGGAVQLYATCGGINNSYIGQYGLSNRFDGEFNTAEFTLPEDLFQVLSGARGEFSNCSLTATFQVNPGGQWLLDNLGFY